MTGESNGIRSINENDLNLYPNPVQNVLNVHLEGYSGIMQIQDISGKLVMQQHIAQNITSVDVSGLERGIYIVKVSCATHVFTSKIVKY